MLWRASRRARNWELQPVLDYECMIERDRPGSSCIGSRKQVTMSETEGAVLDLSAGPTSTVLVLLLEPDLCLVLAVSMSPKNPVKQPQKQSAVVSLKGGDRKRVSILHYPTPDKRLLSRSCYLMCNPCCDRYAQEPEFLLHKLYPIPIRKAQLRVSEPIAGLLARRNVQRRNVDVPQF